MQEFHLQSCTTPPAIHFDSISLSFDGELLFSDFSATIGAGSCTCLLGPSGCGKSTLLKIVSGNPDLSYSGRVHFNGVENPGISWMAQSDLLLPWLSVQDNVLLGARLRSEITPELHEMAGHLLDEAGLADQGEKLPAELSGGMRQRVALLRTLLEDRPVILMDEPFSALDAQTRLKLQNLAARLTRGKTVLMVTHDPMEAMRLGDKVMVLRGRPAGLVASIEMDGATPRNPEDGQVQQGYVKLLKLLMEEI
ncbi:ABC transporter ATP-binding protein [Desulfosediminicola ganghwensis]|uniref:ABC transporter ATP-binding protein n=1 Tax=Desulfosediminicola ganghwensis TaxID=2569540 RepID=UPI0010ACC3B9|nr:ABC transporter ATP-binding protein [Desulfosediminicola ganghwensis]